MSKKTVLVDFDGVLHGYESGWQGHETIPDPPVSGAKEWMESVAEHFDVVIFSTRAASRWGKRAIEVWLKDNGFPEPALVTHEKEPGIMLIDDRAFCFQGTFPTVEKIKEFRPWNRKKSDVSK